MQIGDIEYEVNDRVATITLNRPDKFNAITERMPVDSASVRTAYGSISCRCSIPAVAAWSRSAACRRDAGC